MRAEVGAPIAASGERLGHHDVDVHTRRGAPSAGVLSWREPARFEQFGEQWLVAQQRGFDAEVGVGGELGDDEVGRARVEVDGLGADQDDGVEVRGQRVGCVEQRGPGADVLLIEFARHARCLSSMRGAPRLPTGLGRVL